MKFDTELKILIADYLSEVGFEPSSRRKDQLFHWIKWDCMLTPSLIEDIDVNNYAENLYNYQRLKATKLSRKVYKDKIIHDKNGWILIRKIHD